MLPPSVLVAAWLGLMAGALGGPPASFVWPGSTRIDLQQAAALPDPQRLRAIEELSIRQGPAFVPDLVPLLRDPDPGVRLYAARRLARLGDAAAIEAARSWIVSPPVAQVDRPFGLDVLSGAAVLPAPARRAIEQALRDPDAAIRSLALDALERHDVRPSLPVLLEALDDDSREIRLHALRLLAGIDDDRATLPLVARIEDSDRQVRLEAIRALASHPKAAAVLLRIASEGADEARVAAVDAIGAARASSATDLLVQLARRRPADELSRHAQLALGRLATADAVATLLALTRTPPVTEETRAAMGLAGPAAVPALIRELDTGAPGSAQLAAATLGQLGDRRATAALVRTIDGRPDLAPTALVAIARLGDASALPALARAAESPLARTRRAALDALLALRDARGAAVLDRALADPDSAVRQGAARLAAALDAAASTPALLPLLSDADAGVRGAAASALARLARPSAGAVATVLAAVSRVATKRADEEWRTIGDILAGMAVADDVRPLGAALSRASGAERLALLQGLAAAGRLRRIEDNALVRRLLSMLDEGGAIALAAADALSVARVPGGEGPTLARTFAAAEPSVAARLCATIARLPEGDEWLAGVIADGHQPEEIRAAAIWAARDLDRPRSAIEAAARGTDRLAVNARAARAKHSADARAASTRIIVRTSQGTPAVGRWVAFYASPGDFELWAKTDVTGAVSVEGLPARPLTLRLDGGLLRSTER